MTSNLLCFNSSKTEFLLLGLKPQLNKIQSPALCLSNGVSVLPSASARNLGFIFDSNLTLADQISSVSRACFYHIRDLRRIRPVLDFTTAQSIGASFVHSRLDYCNSLFYGLPKIQLNRLQHIQNSLARAVVAAPRSSDSNQILKSLHWLKVPDRIEYKVISVTYKLPQASAPHYLRDIISFQSARSTRSSSLVTHQFSQISRSRNAHSGMQLLTCGISFRHLFVFHLQVLSHPSLIHIMDQSVTCLMVHFILVLKLIFSSSPFLPRSVSSYTYWSAGTFNSPLCGRIWRFKCRQVRQIKPAQLAFGRTIK